MVGTYITYFYTNILGISPAMAGMVFMVARLVDAFTDPLTRKGEVEMQEKLDKMSFVNLEDDLIL